VIYINILFYILALQKLYKLYIIAFPNGDFLNNSATKRQKCELYKKLVKKVLEKNESNPSANLVERDEPGLHVHNSNTSSEIYTDVDDHCSDQAISLLSNS